MRSAMLQINEYDDDDDDDDDDDAVRDTARRAGLSAKAELLVVYSGTLKKPCFIIIIIIYTFV